MQTQATVLIVPGLRDHVEEHWQTLLQARLDKACSVPPLTVNKLDCAARVDNIQRAIDAIEGDIILVAHSAGCLMVAHWAARHQRPIKGALLAAPPDLNADWPASYPSPATLGEHGWAPLPGAPLPFPSILAASSNDYLASIEASTRLAAAWGSELVNLGAVGHLNPASGFGRWVGAEALIRQLDS
ncbi:MAG: alpha/beta hydrolase [Gammaproteobacteria bacterium]|uniref:RBBP9/YdeN family alpha/beta hydrolase n=1 Tax=Pseudomaricurvus alcaniphilus TaxID=1166482 RepID=UPI00140E22F4|nr:alpha/beta hydrolase [Pseudomaricurvus alcaniphilus]MBR9909514.1 alpha/beta hydrolase [Gammaproteobacteria bacterium]NHN37072.1 alpha/beta hydrolase [Pseudomaricurvus alcaniphilus]